MATIFTPDEATGPEAIKRRQRFAEGLMKQGTDASPVKHWTQALARVLQGGMGGYLSGQADREEKANQSADSAIRTKLLGELLSGSSSPSAAASATAADTSTVKPANVTPEVKEGIVQTASALGVDPVDLATTISYETGGTFDPTKRGPTTKWGQHRGFIQFGEPQAKQHGVDWNNPVASQLGPNGAVVSYLKAAGVKPGMGLLDIYSAINAGAPGLYDRSDAAAGGAPGTVRDKVEQQMGGHRAKARALLSASADMPAQGSVPSGMQGGSPGFFVPPGEDPAPMSAGTFNAITAGQPLDPAFQSEGVSQPWMGTALPQQAPAPPPGPQMVQSPLPAPRPAELSQADMPAQGSVPAIGQFPVQPMPDLTSAENAGALPFAVQEGERRQGQPSAPSSPGVLQALFGGGATPQQAQQAPAIAQAVASAPAPTTAQVKATSSVPNQALIEALTNPRASATTQALAASILNKRIDAQNKARWTEETLSDGSLAQRNSQTGEIKIVRPGVDPMDREGKRLEIETKKKALGKAEAPTTKVVKQADGSEVALQWDQASGEWVPLKAPQGGNAVGSSPGNPYALPGKPTESQSKDAGFAGRMVESHNIINDLESMGTNRTQTALGAVPLIGNALSSADKQRFEQAKRNFVTATLRKESGAAISQGEFDTEEKKYFPQVGDSPQVIEQKRRARELAIEGVMAGAGTGYKVPDTYKPGAKKEPAAAGKPPPAGVDANVWKHMTPEERALWN